MLAKASNHLEDVVGWSVAAAAFPPSFNDTSVVSIESVMASWESLVGNGSCQEIESHSFCPSDVSAGSWGVPPWYQSPCSPSISDDNANSHFRACVRVGLGVLDCD